MTHRSCDKCIGPECICHEVEPEKLDGRTIQEWAYIARGFGEKSDRLEAQIREDIAPCVFHDNAHADCVQHSGQAPCMTQTESDWLREMQKERDALAAHVERYHAAYVKLTNSETIEDADTRETMYLATQSLMAEFDAISESRPTTSLARLKAEAIQRAADELCDNIGGDIGYGDLMDYAENLRCQSGGGA